jgi:FAD-dependent urate hydroxylase
VLDNFHLRSDEARWLTRFQGRAMGSSSPMDSVLRAVEFPNFYLHLDAPWKALRAKAGKALVEAGDGIFGFDFVIAGTGYQYDPATRPELQRIASDVALWKDRYQPPPELASQSLGVFPYLGPGYELLEKEPGRAPWLSDVHVFNAAAYLSFGLPVGDNVSLRAGVPRLVSAISRDLYFADQSRPEPTVKSSPTVAAESSFDKYAHAIWRQPSLS